MTKLDTLQMGHNTHGWLKSEEWVPNHAFLLYDLNTDHTYHVSLTSPLVWGYEEMGVKGHLKRLNRYGASAERGRSIRVAKARGYHIQTSTTPMHVLHLPDRAEIPSWEWTFWQRIGINADKLFGQETLVYKRQTTVAQWLVDQGLHTQYMQSERHREWDKKIGPWLAERTGWDTEERYTSIRFLFPHPWGKPGATLSQDEALCIAYEMGYIGRDDKPTFDAEDEWPIQLSRWVVGYDTSTANLDLPMYTCSDLGMDGGDELAQLAAQENTNVELVCDRFINTSTEW